jgi:hypothetical protein
MDWSIKNKDISMSIEKLDFASLRHEQKNFTTHLNVVLQNVKNSTALGIWSYLSSLPPNWKINKQQLRSHFALGRATLNRALACLCAHNLLEIVQERKSDGTFFDNIIILKSGSDFILIENHDNMRSELTVFQKTVDGLTANGETTSINKIDLKIKDNIKRKEKILSAPSVAHDQNEPFFSFLSTDEKPSLASNKSYLKKYPSNKFDDFYQIYPRKKDRKRAEQIWNKLKLDNYAAEIIEDVKLRLRQDGQWQDPQYIPYPATYLRNERWKDEITPIKAKPEHHITKMLREMKESARVVNDFVEIPF